MNWSAQTEHAAQLLAQGDLTNVQIANQLGVSLSTIQKWSAQPEFKERIEQNVEDLRERIAEESFQAYQARTNWREPLLEDLVAMVSAFTAEDFEPLKKNPISLINLALRLQNTVDSIERRRDRYEHELDDYPFCEDISPETEERIMEAIEQARST